MWTIKRIFHRRTKGYMRPVLLRYDRVLVFDGSLGTGDELFTKERTPLQPLIYHAFVFALDPVEYEIWVKDDANTCFDLGRSYRAHLNADGTYCWFNGHETLVRDREPNHEAEDDAS